MKTNQASGCLRFGAAVLITQLAYSPLCAQTHDKFAADLEAKLKSATCSPRLRTYASIPDYRECGNGIGTEAWFQCAGGIDRANRAIFYWNSFIEKCRKKNAK